MIRKTKIDQVYDMNKSYIYHLLNVNIDLDIILKTSITNG